MVKILDMKSEGGGKKGKNVKVHIEFETCRRWVELEHAMSDWPNEVKAFKEEWEKQRCSDEQEKKRAKRNSDEIFTCDQDHEDPAGVALTFGNQESNADYWKDGDHTDPCMGCLLPIVDGKTTKHIKGKNIKPTKRDPIHMCRNNSQGCKCCLCNCCLKGKLAANPDRGTPSKRGCRQLQKKPKLQALQTAFEAESS